MYVNSAFVFTYIRLVITSQYGSNVFTQWQFFLSLPYAHTYIRMYICTFMCVYAYIRKLTLILYSCICMYAHVRMYIIMAFLMLYVVGVLVAQLVSTES